MTNKQPMTITIENAQFDELLDVVFRHATVKGLLTNVMAFILKKNQIENYLIADPMDYLTPFGEDLFKYLKVDFTAADAEDGRDYTITIF